MFEGSPRLNLQLGADSEGNVLTLLTSLDLDRHWLGFEPEPGAQGPSRRFLPAGCALYGLPHAGQGLREGLV